MNTDEINESNGAIVTIISIAILSKKLSHLTGKSQEKIQIDATNEAVKFLNSKNEEEITTFLHKNFPIK